jgi:hypothetical protein
MTSGSYSLAELVRATGLRAYRKQRCHTHSPRKGSVVRKDQPYLLPILVTGGRNAWCGS